MRNLFVVYMRYLRANPDTPVIGLYMGQAIEYNSLPPGFDDPLTVTEDEYDMFHEEYRKMVAFGRTWAQQAPLTAAAKAKKEGEVRPGSRERQAQAS